MGCRPWVYALYRGDEFVDIGTKKELCGRYGIPSATLDCAATTFGKSRSDGSRGGIVVVALGTAEDWEMERIEVEKGACHGKA